MDDDTKQKQATPTRAAARAVPVRPPVSAWGSGRDEAGGQDRTKASADGSSWRPEWRKAKPRTGEQKPARAGKGGSRARATLPTPEQMRDAALRVLLEVAEDPTAPPASRVGAAGRLLDHLPPPIQVPGWMPPASEPAPSTEPDDEDNDPSWT